LNSQGKNWIINKWASIITPIISKSRVISITALPWIKNSDNSYDEHEHRKELVTEGMNTVFYGPYDALFSPQM